MVVNYLSLPWTYLKEPLYEKADACLALVTFGRRARSGLAADLWTIDFSGSCQCLDGCRGAEGLRLRWASPPKR